MELHCHLDGSLPIKLVRELTKDFSVSKEQLQVQKDCESLAQYLEKFDLPLTCLQTREGLERAGTVFLQEVAKENVRYIEVRFAPMLSVNADLSCEKVLESLLKGLEQGFQKCGVHYNVIVCAMRHHSIEQNLEMLKISREFLGEGVCALDLAGDEASYPTRNFRELFLKASKWDMPFTIHAGECGSVEEVREAYTLGAKRVGHGIALRKDEQLIQEFADKKIGIEMCPTSNLQTKAIADLSEYPLLSFLEQGLMATVNTDNRTVSNTSMTKELEIIYESCGRQKEIIYQLLRNGIEVSFADAALKDRLIREVENFQ